MPPLAMMDVTLDNLHAELAGNRRQESVHFAVEPHRLDDLGAKYFQRTAIVVELDAGRERDDPVGNDRRQAAIEKRILPLPPPPGHDVGARVFGELDHAGNVRRVVLQVAVGGHDEAAARMGEPR